MGYCSTVVIAINKKALASSLLLNNLPKLLREWPYQEHGESHYWRLEDIKWYDSYAVIQEILNYFSSLDDLVPELPTPLNGAVYGTALYGAIRMGEDNEDLQEWGDPEHYDIYFTREINSPIRKICNTDTPG